MASKELTLQEKLEEVQFAIMNLVAEQGSLECHTMEASLKGWPISPALQKVIHESDLRMAALTATETRLRFEMRVQLVNDLYEKEKKGLPLHTRTDLYLRPPSRLMYLDDGRPIFLRDHEDRYSSYQFWMEGLGVEDPLSVLGKGKWVSCVELGVSANLLDELYEIESRMLETKNTTEADLARDLEIRGQFKKQ
jgi:hypothetical protein